MRAADQPPSGEGEPCEKQAGEEPLISIVSAELATAKPERTFAAGKPVEVTRVRITDAGRLALADQG